MSAKVQAAEFISAMLALGGLFEVSQTWLLLPVTPLFPGAASCSECCTALQKLKCGLGNGNSEAENKSESSIASICLL